MYCAGKRSVLDFGLLAYDSDCPRCGGFIRAVRLFSVCCLATSCLATDRDSNEMCGDWAAAGECSSAYMRDTCPESCRNYLIVDAVGAVESQEGDEHDDAQAADASNTGHATRGIPKGELASEANGQTQTRDVFIVQEDTRESQKDVDVETKAEAKGRLAQTTVMVSHAHMEAPAMLPIADALTWTPALKDMAVSFASSDQLPACLAIVSSVLGALLWYLFAHRASAHAHCRKESDVSEASQETSLPLDASGGTGEAGQQNDTPRRRARSKQFSPNQADLAEESCNMSHELELSLASEGQSLNSVRKELEKLRARLKSRDAALDERESVLSAGERRIAADSFALREQSQRSEQEVERLIKRGAELEAAAAKLRAELETEREAGAGRVSKLERQLDEQRSAANASMKALEHQHEMKLNTLQAESGACTQKLKEQVETHRREANAKIIELEVQLETSQEHANKTQKELQSMKDELALVKESAEDHAERLSTRTRELESQARDLQKREQAADESARKNAAEATAFSGQADSQRQAYYRLVAELTELRNEIGPLRAASTEVNSLREELHRRSLAADEREQELGINAREQAARAKTDSAEIVALRAQAASQAATHFKLLEENSALKRQLHDVDNHTCHVRKHE